MAEVADKPFSVRQSFPANHAVGRSGGSRRYDPIAALRLIMDFVSSLSHLERGGLII